MIELATGNLLKADVEALVNPVNTQGVMGKGLALQFKRAFPDAFKAYAKACARGEVVTGRMHVVRRASPPRFIIHFPTKRHWRDPSKLEYVTSGLEDLVRSVRELHIESLAIPALGCGLGGLSWAEVEPLIVDAFETLPDVRVLLFAPGMSP